MSAYKVLKSRVFRRVLFRSHDSTARHAAAFHATRGHDASRRHARDRGAVMRSEERRVGKACRSRRSPEHEKKKTRQKSCGITEKRSCASRAYIIVVGHTLVY